MIMANTLSISKATLVGGSSFVNSVFTVTSGATTISERNYLFSANLFSAIYDPTNPNIGLFNLGQSHSENISNGDYNVLMFDGVVYANIQLLVAAYVSDIAAYTT